jgi:hypothetical protein
MIVNNIDHIGWRYANYLNLFNYAPEMAEANHSFSLASASTAESTIFCTTP